MASDHDPEEVPEKDEEEASEDAETKKPDRPDQEVEQGMLPRVDSPMALDYLGDSEDTDQAMLSSIRSPSSLDFLGPRAHLGSPVDLDPQKQVEAVVNEVIRHVKMHRFDRARDALKMLPPELRDVLVRELRGKLDRAESLTSRTSQSASVDRAMLTRADSPRSLDVLGHRNPHVLGHGFSGARPFRRQERGILSRVWRRLTWWRD